MSNPYFNPKNPPQSPIFPSQDHSRKSNRSKIELTYIANPSEDRPLYSQSQSQLYPHSTIHQRPHGIQIEQQRGNVIELGGRGPIDQHVLTLMREQIDIATHNYKEKMGQTLKIQAQEIQKLSAIIIHNNRTIQKQQEIIHNLSRN